MSETEAKVSTQAVDNIEKRVARLEMQLAWLHRTLQHGILGGMEMPGVTVKDGDGSEGPL